MGKSAILKNNLLFSFLYGNATSVIDTKEERITITLKHLKNNLLYEMIISIKLNDILTSPNDTIIFDLISDKKI